MMGSSIIAPPLLKNHEWWACEFRWINMSDVFKSAESHPIPAASWWCYDCDPQ